MFYAVSEFEGADGGAGHVMSNRGAVVLAVLGALLGLLALHPLSAAYAGVAPHPVAVTAVPASAPAASSTPDAGAGHIVGCPESPADGLPAPLSPSRDDDRPMPTLVGRVAATAPAEWASALRSPITAEPPALAGTRLLIGICVSRT